MKARLFMVLILFGLSTFALPCTSQAWHGHGGSGWYWTGGFLGGLFLGSALNGPYYPPPRSVYVYPSPPVVYAPPPPVYVYPAPSYGYAYPNPGYSQAQPSNEQGTDSAKGEWITVPGQWVKGRWVPEHKTWVPFAP